MTRHPSKEPLDLTDNRYFAKKTPSAKGQRTQVSGGLDSSGKSESQRGGPNQRRNLPDRGALVGTDDKTKTSRYSQPKSRSGTGMTPRHNAPTMKADLLDIDEKKSSAKKTPKKADRSNLNASDAGDSGSRTDRSGYTRASGSGIKRHPSEEKLNIRSSHEKFDLKKRSNPSYVRK
jgi:hypothetical protein